MSCGKRGYPARRDASICATTPGHYGAISGGIIICPPQFAGVCDGTMCTTLLHEMVHGCGEADNPNPESPEEYCEGVGEGNFPPGGPRGKGPSGPY